MVGESQKAPPATPDPSTLTTEQMLREVQNAEERFDARFDAIITRLNGIDRATQLLHDDLVRFPTEVQKEVGHLKELTDVKLNSATDAMGMRESYRLELKSDAEKALLTAMTAAEKAVQAALAAAEKARDQQTIASQLATDKAEKSFVEALAQLNGTFSVAIANVVAGIDETKAGLGELRAEKRGGAANQSSIYAFVGFAGGTIGLLLALFGSGVLGK